MSVVYFLFIGVSKREKFGTLPDVISRTNFVALKNKTIINYVNSNISLSV